MQKQEHAVIKSVAGVGNKTTLRHYANWCGGQQQHQHGGKVIHDVSK